MESRARDLTEASYADQIAGANHSRIALTRSLGIGISIGISIAPGCVRNGRQHWGGGGDGRGRSRLRAAVGTQGRVVRAAVWSRERKPPRVGGARRSRAAQRSPTAGGAGGGGAISANGGCA